MTAAHCSSGEVVCLQYVIQAPGNAQELQGQYAAEMITDLIYTQRPYQSIHGRGDPSTVFLDTKFVQRLDCLLVPPLLSPIMTISYYFTKGS